MSECDEMKLKVQALADNELDEMQIPGVVHHIESCYKCRDEYIQFLTFQKKMEGIGAPKPNKEWFEELNKRRFRRFSSLIGRILFLGSYVLLIAYVLYSFFSSSEGDVIVKILVGTVIAGVAVLLAVTIADRGKERETDKYRGVMK